MGLSILGWKILDWSFILVVVMYIINNDRYMLVILIYLFKFLWYEKIFILGYNCVRVVL